MNQSSNILRGNFKNSQNVRVPIQFRKEKQSQHLKTMTFLEGQHHPLLRYSNERKLSFSIIEVAKLLSTPALTFQVRLKFTNQLQLLPQTVFKPVLTTTFLKKPYVRNDHVVVLPKVFRSNFSLQSNHLYSATNDHLNDVPGFLLPAFNDHCTKGLSQKL